MSPGSVYNIQWNATDNIGITSTDIDYTYDGGTNWFDVADLSGNPGSYNWTVPNTPSTQCLVKVTCFDAATNSGFDVSDGFFTIEEAPVPYVWVQSIDLSIESKGPNTNAQATVLVLDQDNNPVFKGEVHSHWGGITTDSDVFSTKKNGTGSCESDKVKNPVGWWYFYVDDVVVAGYVFRSDLGETYDQMYVGGAKLAAHSASEFSVTQNYPNPFNFATEFTLSLPVDTKVSFVIYNIAGQKVKTLADDYMNAGTHTLTWDGTNEVGQVVSSGIYFYRLVAGENLVTKKMMLMK